MRMMNMSSKEIQAEGDGFLVYTDRKRGDDIVIRLDSAECIIQTNTKGFSRVSVSIPKAIASYIGEALIRHCRGDGDFSALLGEILEGVDNDE